MVSAILFISFAFFLLIGTPIAICLGMSSVFAIIADSAGRPLDAVLSVVPMLVSSSSSKFVLLAIPFFILSGNIMEKAGISEKSSVLSLPAFLQRFPAQVRQQLQLSA